MPSRYRADQVGSLLRPAEVLRARAELQAGRIGLEQLRAVEDQAILDALRLQRRVGLDVLTDGEFRRGAWQTDMAEAVEGFVADHIAMAWHGPNAGAESSQAQVIGGPLRQRRRLTAHESAFLKEHAPGPFKVTIPSASTFRDASYKPGLTDRFYPTSSDLLGELVRIVRGEIAALVEQRVPYVQIDAPRLSYYVGPRMREQIRQSEVDPERALDEAIEAENACLEGIDRAGVILGLHLCRGNSRSRWRAEGGYEPIAEKLFGSLQHDRFLLEYDVRAEGEDGRARPRHHQAGGVGVAGGAAASRRGGLEVRSGGGPGAQSSVRLCLCGSGQSPVARRAVAQAGARGRHRP